MKIDCRAALAALGLVLSALPALAEESAPAAHAIGATPIAIIVGLILITAGASIWLFASARRGKQRAQASLTWPETPGKVIESRIVQRTAPGGAEAPDTDYFRPHVRYAYALGGTSYEGNTIRFGSLESTDIEKAQAYLAKYPQGAEIAVRYDPADPKVATLESQAATGGLFGLAVLMAALALACLGLLGYFLML